MFCSPIPSLIVKVRQGNYSTYCLCILSNIFNEVLAIHLYNYCIHTGILTEHYLNNP